MAAVYSNALGLFNLTTKGTPTTSDYVVIGDAAVTGVPVKQATIASLPFAGSPGGLVKIASVTASASASVLFSNQFNSTYDNYFLVFEKLLLSSSGAITALVGYGGTPTYAASGYLGYSLLMSTAASSAMLTTAYYLNGVTSGYYCGTTTAQLSAGTIQINNVNNTTGQICLHSAMYGLTSSAVNNGAINTGLWFINSGDLPMTSLKIISPDSYNTTGVFTLFGYAK